MTTSMEDLIRHVQRTPPTCLAGFGAKPAPDEEWNDRAGWSLSCSCGSEVGQLMGYSLKDFRRDYQGDLVFVSPLGLACGSCGTTTEIIDTKSHGYNSEIDKENGKSWDSNYRGVGPRQSMPCLQCGGRDFTMRAFFGHSHFDLIDDRPELAPRSQDFFDTFELHGVCQSCHTESNLAGFELA